MEPLHTLQGWEVGRSMAHFRGEARRRSITGSGSGPPPSGFPNLQMVTCTYPVRVAFRTQNGVKTSEVERSERSNIAQCSFSPNHLDLEVDQTETTIKIMTMVYQGDMSVHRDNE
jgi:hypothetical protein